MSGETDLQRLLAGLTPTLSEDEFVFCTLPETSITQPLSAAAFAIVHEAEGSTLIVKRTLAEARELPFDATFCRITLAVHSSLQAVGLTAAVSGKLASTGISANVVAGYFHDYVFVPADRSAEALRLLLALANPNTASPLNAE